MEADALKVRAKRAYELGRVRRGLRFAVLPLPLMILSTNVCGAPIPICLTGGALMLLVALFAWRGGSYEAAIKPGLFAGLGAYALPLIGEVLGLCGGERMMAASLCFLGGVLTGAFLGARVIREPIQRGRFLFAGCVIASLVGSLGCVLAGLGGVLGMVLGVTTISIPAVLLVKRA